MLVSNYGSIAVGIQVDHTMGRAFNVMTLAEVR